MTPISIPTPSVLNMSTNDWLYDITRSNVFKPGNLHLEIKDFLYRHEQRWNDFVSFVGIVLHDHVQQLYTQWPDQNHKDHSIAYRPITVIAMTRYIPGMGCTSSETIFCHIYDYTSQQGKPFECKLHQLIHVTGFQLTESEYDDQCHIQALEITPIDIFQCYDGTPIQHPSTLLDCSKALEIKRSFLEVLTRIFSGDCLVAEYVLLSVFSKIQSRIVGWLDSLTIGNMPMNIILSNQSQETIQFVTKQLQQFLPVVSTISVDLNSLHEKSLSVSMDISCFSLEEHSSLESISPLYLADGSLLILDETKLDSGTLNFDGLKNLRILSNLVHRQILISKTSEDFEVEVEVDIPTIIFTNQGASIIKIPLQLPWNQSDDIVLDAKRHDDDFVDSIRDYIKGPRLTECPILTQDMASKMESLIPEEMEKDANSDSKYQDFHILLTLSRWIAMSEHCNNIRIEHLEYAKKLERKRKNRISKQEIK